MSYPGNNNSNIMRNPYFALKGIMIGFLVFQAIRQLVHVNIQANNSKETPTGRVSAWFTICLTLIAAGILAPRDRLPDWMVKGSLFGIIGFVLATGILMIYDGIKKDAANPEKNRLWFGIAHVIFAMLVMIYTMILLTQ